MSIDQYLENDYLEDAAKSMLQDKSYSRHHEDLEAIISSIVAIERKNRVGTISLEDYELSRNKFRVGLIAIKNNSSTTYQRSKKGNSSIYFYAGLLFFAIISIFIYSNANSNYISDSEISGSIIGNDNIVNLPRVKEKVSRDNLKINLWVSTNRTIDDWLSEAGVRYPTYIDYDSNKKVPSLNFKFTETLEYDAKFNNEVLNIYPKLSHLKELRSGGIIKGGKMGANIEDPAWFPMFIPQFPELDIKLVNNSDEVIFVNRIEVLVQESKINLEPIVYLSHHPFDINSFYVYNDGYGDMINVKVNYSLYPNGYANFNFNQSNHSFEVDKIDDMIDHSIKKDLSYYDIFFNDGDEFKEGQEYINLLGKLKPNKYPKDGNEFFIQAAGTVSYSYYDRDKNKINKTIKFVTPVQLPRTGFGAPEGFSGKYSSNLKYEGNNYSINVPVSHSIKPAEVDRIGVDLRVEKSSNHKFKIKVFYNDDQFLESHKISADILFTRSCNLLLEKI